MVQFSLMTLYHKIPKKSMWETKNFFLITAAEDSSSRDRRNTSKIPRRERNQNCINPFFPVSERRTIISISGFIMPKTRWFKQRGKASDDYCCIILSASKPSTLITSQSSVPKRRKMTEFRTISSQITLPQPISAFTAPSVAQSSTIRSTRP